MVNLTGNNTSPEDIEYAIHFYASGVELLKEELSILDDRLQIVENARIESFAKQGDENFKLSDEYLLTKRRYNALELRKRIDEVRGNVTAMTKRIVELEQKLKDGKESE